MFTLEQVVPWGRSFDEYKRMFDLSSDDLRLRILGCADAPAGYSVTSCDPLYRFSATDIARRTVDTTEVIIEQTRRNQEEFLWNLIRSIDELRSLRISAMERFLADFDAGKSEGRYVDAELPNLPFDDGEFDLALCSHFLFLYSEQLSEELHVTAIRDITRMAREVRIFPLLALGAARSSHVDPSLSGSGPAVLL